MFGAHLRTVLSALALFLPPLVVSGCTDNDNNHGDEWSQSDYGYDDDDDYPRHLRGSMSRREFDSYGCGRYRCHPYYSTYDCEHDGIEGSCRALANGRVVKIEKNYITKNYYRRGGSRGDDRQDDNGRRDGRFDRNDDWFDQPGLNERQQRAIKKQRDENEERAHRVQEEARKRERQLRDRQDNDLSQARHDRDEGRRPRDRNDRNEGGNNNKQARCLRQHPNHPEKCN